ncbi:MAG: hypothetical protein ACRDRL_21175, partial [Sciscionella sp.]
MSEARRSREAYLSLAALLRDVPHSIADARALVLFRIGLLRSHRTLATVAALGAAAVTLLAAIVPAYAPGAQVSRTANNFLLLLPSAYTLLLLAVALAVISAGGGRELLPAEQAVALPISTTTDHLGALLLAPLNIAWALEAWTMLGVTAYALGPRPQLWA